MSQPNSPQVVLAQCTGVTSVPVTVFKHNITQGSVKPSLKHDSRQPLHENNSQTSPCSSSSQKPSRTHNSDSILITPSEERKTALALSPERPLPAGQQWPTLEVQRVLSLTPGTRPTFKHSGQHGSLETSQTAGGTPASCSPGSTVAADDSPARQRAMATTPSSEAKAGVNGQQAVPGFIPPDVFPATEMQLPDIPPTQLACAATALDLLLCDSTQVVSEPVGVGSVLLDGGHTAQNSMQALQELALSLSNAQGLTATPAMMLAPLQATGMGNSEAVRHGRAPAGPVASPTAIRAAGIGTAQHAHSASPELNAAVTAITAAGESLNCEGKTGASHTDMQAQQAANAMDSSAMHVAVINQQQAQQKVAVQPAADSGLLPQHDALQSLPISSCGTGVGTEETASQVRTHDCLRQQDMLWLDHAIHNKLHCSAVCVTCCLARLMWCLQRCTRQLRQMLLWCEASRWHAWDQQWLAIADTTHSCLAAMLFSHDPLVDTECGC